MKIDGGRVIVCSPGRNFVTLQLRTSDGIVGLGDATLNGRELSVVSYLEDHVLPTLIGRDPRNIQDIWSMLYVGAYWRGGPVGMTAISAVDMALWDLKGKQLGAPVHQLLGGRARESVAVYGHANGQDIPSTVEAVGKYLEMGYHAVRAQSAVTGSSGSYGVGKGDLYYEPAVEGLPEEQSWSTDRYLGEVGDLFSDIRREHGHDFRLLHDAHHRLTPNEAAILGKTLEPYRLFWLEDSVPAELQQRFRHVRNHTTTPLAVGEVFSSIYDLTTLVSEQLVDFIRMTVTHAGGITNLMKIAAFAEPFAVRTGSHGATDLSPVSMAAALQVDITIPNFGIQEYMRHTEETDAVFPHAYRFENGALHPGDEPGLGVELNESLVAEFPYRRAYLPINRLEDGTIHGW